MEMERHWRIAGAFDLTSLMTGSGLSILAEIVDTLHGFCRRVEVHGMKMVIFIANNGKNITISSLGCFRIAFKANIIVCHFADGVGLNINHIFISQLNTFESSRYEHLSTCKSTN